jgi:nucleoside-diphosphate-sugar epimerase
VRKVFVTGGLGFQGFALAQALLARGDAVTILSTPSLRNRERFHRLHEWMAQAQIPPPRLHVVMGSVADAEILEKSIPGHEAIVHMAAWTSVDASLDRPWPSFEINAHGTLAVLDSCRRFGDPGVKLLIASSCEVYGPTQTRNFLNVSKAAPDDDWPDAKFEMIGYAPQNESWPLMPRSPYAASKIAADRYAHAYAVTYGLDVTILRPCNIYGPGQRAGAMGAVIPIFTQRALTGQPLVVTGGGQQFREFLYIDDLVRAYLAVLDATGEPGVPYSEPGTAYNVGSGETRTVLEIAQAILTRLAPTGRIDQSAARVADVSGFLLDSSRFRGAFGWTSKVAFTVGLSDYLDWAKLQHDKGESV